MTTLLDPPSSPIFGGRVFVALWPPSDVAIRIAHGAAPIVAQAHGRAVATADLHLTLAFLGELTETQRAAAAAALRGPAPEAFDLALDRLGCFRRARVLWAAPSLPPPGLIELHAVLCERLAAAGFALDRRAFKAHVTVARSRATLRTRRFEPPIVWHADTLVLATSSPEPGLPRYRRLAVRSLSTP